MDNLFKIIEKECLLEGNFTLRSGKTVSQYFDKYLFESNPKILSEIARRMAEQIAPDVEVLAGLEMGGIPIVTALSIETGLPAAFVRKEAKPHGTAKLAEGAPVNGKRTLIIEDIISTGGQVALSAADLRAVGANVVGAFCVITRSKDVYTLLSEHDISLTALYDTSTI